MRADFARMFDSALWALTTFFLVGVVVSAICAAVLYFLVAGSLRAQRAATAVDDETRKRIAAAVKRLEAPAAEGGKAADATNDRLRH